MPCEPAAPQEAVQRLAMLHGNEQLIWLCQSQGNDAPAVLITGWAGLVRYLAIECIDVAAAPKALIHAEAWLTKGAGNWHFGQNGSASWCILLPDGAWSATLLETQYLAGQH